MSSLNRPPSEYDKTLAILAVDFVTAYSRFVDELPDPETVTIDNFDAFFRKSQLEYMHYSGGASFSCPFHTRATEAILELSAAYLYLPNAVTQRHARLFGLMLCYFFYSTQPQRAHDSSLPPVTIPIDLHIMEALVGLLEHRSAASPDVTADAVATYHASSFSCASPPPSVPLTTAESVAVLSLHEHHAWHVQPYAATRSSLSALIRAHEAAGVPLLKEGITQAAAAAAGAQGTAARHGSASRRPLARGGAAAVTLPPACGPLLSDDAFRRRLEEYQMRKKGLS